ncbi:hypothetical protein TOK_2803 [Pseudonocardia sp. N23]|nr:hypothetical protein TOK_2803 [Pseudonocardia sp. N23]
MGHRDRRTGTARACRRPHERVEPRGSRCRRCHRGATLRANTLPRNGRSAPL